MGDWIYYSCLMDLSELSSRVHYASEIHKSRGLSDMIQRRLESGRATQIAEYLKEQPHRFFNSLVVATYGGQPNWYGFSDIRNKRYREDLENLSEETIESVGFLTFKGDEKLFALDGQHRLAGIKKAFLGGLEQDPYDEVSVIFVAHKNTTEGLKKTRRLFTTLNKTARSVSKADIIALDEDDVMAVCVRRLIEETDLFESERIAFVETNNMPVSNTESLTTIGNLYDILVILFTQAQFNLKEGKSFLQRVRPNDVTLNEYFEYAREYFAELRSNFKELNEFFTSEVTTSVVTKYRGRHGGKVLFRPLGLEIITRVIARLTKDMSLGQAVTMASLLPRNLDEAPFEGLLWDSNTKTIANGHKVTLREVLLFMLGKNSMEYPEAKVLERYRREIGDEGAQLPRRLL